MEVGCGVRETLSAVMAMVAAPAATVVVTAMAMAEHSVVAMAVEAVRVAAAREQAAGGKAAAKAAATMGGPLGSTGHPDCSQHGYRSQRTRALGSRSRSSCPHRRRLGKSSGTSASPAEEAEQVVALVAPAELAGCEAGCSGYTRHR